MPLSFVGAEMPVTLGFSSLAGSFVIVEVEGEREKVLARGPRCVSFSSGGRYVSILRFDAVNVETEHIGSHNRLPVQLWASSQLRVDEKGSKRGIGRRERR